MKSTARRATLVGIATAGLLAVAAAPALAHVTVTPSTTAAGATTVLRVEIPHGCDGSATTDVTLRLPEGITDVNAAGTDRWTVELAADSVTFTTDDPLPDDETAVLEVNANLPDEVGATLVLPVVQTCEKGEAAWTEVAGPGQDPDELDRPASVLVVTGIDGSGDAPGDAPADAPADGAADDTAAGSDGHEGHAGHGGHEGQGGHEGHGGGSGDTEAAAATEDSGAVGTWVVVGAIGVLVVGGVVGRVVLQRRRRQGAP